MHTVPYEGSVGLVNLLTTTRVQRKGFKTSLVLYGPGVLMASGTRGFPNVGDEAFPGHMAINNQLKTFLDEGGTVYACRFASGALYGFPENLLMEGVKPFHPLDVLDSALTAWREQRLPAEHLDGLSRHARAGPRGCDRSRGAGPRPASTRSVMVNVDLYQRLHRRGPRGRGRAARRRAHGGRPRRRPARERTGARARGDLRAPPRRCSR